ncbi:MAG: L-threonylcarbamoyladenylate synthase [Acholeplasmataceae bacterium]|jgi:L-threonylcarbamoyladenylate synthase|nr:L-threonylcarbamoyladenylate synthase [Acholeplasmataceae bacterium]
MDIIKGSLVNQKQVKMHIKEIIQAGGLVVFPTETVYGIGADATNEKAVQKIFIAKGRPSDNPLIVHLAHPKDLEMIVYDIPEVAKPLMKAYWPGPLTLIFWKKEIIPKSVSGGLDTVGVRIPDSKIARTIIEAAGVPICAPSANVSGRPSSTLFEHVLEDFMGKVDLIIDGGMTDIGIESTVLDVTTPIPVLLRPGAITQSMIEKTINMGIIDATETPVHDVPKSPGMKYTHYAPQGDIHLIEGEKENVIEYINKEIKKYPEHQIGVIAPDEYIKSIDAHYKVALGSLLKPEEMGRNLFLALRQMDQLKIKIIMIPALPKEELGQAIMNRLYKAAGQKIIKID